jgi:hypothetical protein
MVLSGQTFHQTQIRADNDVFKALSFLACPLLPIDGQVLPKPRRQVSGIERQIWILLPGELQYTRLYVTHFNAPSYVHEIRRLP